MAAERGGPKGTARPWERKRLLRRYPFVLRPEWDDCDQGAAADDNGQQEDVQEDWDEE